MESQHKSTILLICVFHTCWLGSVLIWLQVCWEKFANHFEVELRDVKLRKDYYVMDPAKAVELCGENTICLCAILGSTWVRRCQDLESIARPEEQGNGVGSKTLKTHFESLIASSAETALNNIADWLKIKSSIMKWLNLPLGWMGNSVLNCMTSQSILLQNCAVESTGKFTILSKEIQAPSVASTSRTEHDVYVWIAQGLREYGWTLPADTMAPDAEKVNFLQVVVT